MALRFGAIACALALVHLISTTAAATTVGDPFAIFDKEHEVLAAVPSQCKAGCDTVNNMLDKICTPSECCTTTLQMEYFNCFTCIGSATNQTDYSQVQGDIDSLFLQCQARGIQLPRPQAFPGQNPNRMVPSTSALPLVAPSTLAPVPSVPATSTITPSTTATPTSGSMRIGAPNDAISSFGQFVVVGSLVVGGMLELF